jgi:hypothetical protein
MMVSTPGEVPEYELNPGEVQFRRGYDVTPVKFSFSYSTISFLEYLVKNVTLGR